MTRVEGLTRSFGDFTAVDDVSFQIGAREIVGLLSHNGGGKTTIMKMLAGFLEPTAGAIEIDGLDIKNAREAIQKKIGYLPKNYPVYPEKVMEYAPCVATALLNEGCWLYGLKPEQRTLESVFIEASMQQGGFCT